MRIGTNGQDMSYFLYILQSQSGDYYIGTTHNLKRRITYHNAGKVRSTKGKRPWKMLYSEKFDTLSGARKRELQIKNWKSRAAIERLIGPIVPDFDSSKSRIHDFLKGNRG